MRLATKVLILIVAGVAVLWLLARQAGKSVGEYVSSGGGGTGGLFGDATNTDTAAIENPPGSEQPSGIIDTVVNGISDAVSKVVDTAKEVVTTPGYRIVGNGDPEDPGNLINTITGESKIFETLIRKKGRVPGTYLESHLATEVPVLSPTALSAARIKTGDKTLNLTQSIGTRAPFGPDTKAINDEFYGGNRPLGVRGKPLAQTAVSRREQTLTGTITTKAGGTRKIAGSAALFARLAKNLSS